MKIRSLAVPMVLALAAGACDSVASSEVKTQEMGVWVFAEVGADGAAKVTTRLTTDNPALLEVTYVRLDEGDALSARLGGSAPMAMSEFTVLGLYEYRASFAGPIVGGETLSVALARTPDQVSAGAQVTLPGPLTVTASAATFSMADGVTIGWSGGAGATEAQVAVSSQDACFDNFTRKAAASAGQLRLTQADFVLKPSAPTTCELVVEVAAVATGAADPAFGRGGNVTARQSRTTPLTMTR